MGEEEVRQRTQDNRQLLDAGASLEVLSALRELGLQIQIAPAHALDSDHVADLLLDHGDTLGPSKLLHLLSALQVGRLQDLAEETCSREYLFLNVAGLADEAVVHLYAGYASGRRQVPFRTWATQTISDVTRRAVANPDLAPFRPEHSEPGEQLVMGIMGHTINKMEREARRLIWLSWIEHRSVPEIVRETGVPLERVEWILAGVIDESKRVVKNLFRGPRPGGGEQGRQVGEGPTN